MARAHERILANNGGVVGGTRGGGEGGGTSMRAYAQEGWSERACVRSHREWARESAYVHTQQERESE